MKEVWALLKSDSFLFCRIIRQRSKEKEALFFSLSFYLLSQWNQRTPFIADIPYVLTQILLNPLTRFFSFSCLSPAIPRKVGESIIQNIRYYSLLAWAPYIDVSDAPHNTRLTEGGGGREEPITCILPRFLSHHIRVSFFSCCHSFFAESVHPYATLLLSCS